MLLWTESFDVVTSASTLQNSGKYVSSNLFQIVTGRNGQGCQMTAAVHGGRTANITMVGDTMIVGIAFKFASNPSGSDFSVFRFVEDGDSTPIYHLVVQMEASTRKLKLYRGNAVTLLATGSVALVASNWYYIEMKMKVHDSAGTYEIRIDGVTDIVGSGADTRNGGSGVIENFEFNGNSLTVVNWDDIYICDNSGTYNNDFLGNVVIEGKLPSTGNGSDTDWAPSTGSDRGALVDESNPNDDSDYVSSATVGQLVTFNYADVTASGTVLGVVVQPYARKSDSGTRNIEAVAHVGGVDYDLTPSGVSLLTTYSYFQRIFETDPATGLPWIRSTLNASEFGIKLTV